MLRAVAYLLLEQIHASKSDVQTVLDANPEHEGARFMLRGIDEYVRAVGVGAKHERAKEWAEALTEYSAAREALRQEHETSTLRKGLCRVHLQLSNYDDVLTWCGKAREAEPYNEELLFNLVDAHLSNNGQHAALQLLKIELMRMQGYACLPA